jgi:mono/diheme cytochrome c family protein
MRRSLILLALLLAGVALLTAGCLDGTEVEATPETVVGEVPTTSEPTADLPALKLEGDAAAGKEQFASDGCGSCHTLAAAGATGAVGPNLDEVKPDFELAVDRITLGKGGMPAFGDRLEAQQIADLAQYIVESTGG